MALLCIAIGGVVVAVRHVAPVEVGEQRPTTGVGQHVPDGRPIYYAERPPVGGPHWLTPAPWGESLVPVPDERAVHNLEHGGVVISYNGLSAEELEQLRNAIIGYPRDRFGEVKVLLRPYEFVPHGSATMTAWGWIATVASGDSASIRAFLDSHLNRCCESVP